MEQNSQVSTGMGFVTFLRDKKGHLGAPLNPPSIIIHYVSSLPARFFFLAALFIASCKTPVVTPEIPVVPPGPDTTSHNWVFDPPVLLGGAQSSALYDVAIVNDSLAYVVGEIYLTDSTGQVDPNPYNVAAWDGQDWTLSKATNVPLRALHAFSENNVWAGSSAPYHWNGTSWTGYNVTGIFGGHINGIWGTSSNNLYIAGTNGSIAHFNGSSWQKIESGTTVDLRDVYGKPDGSVVWACGYSDINQTRGVLLREINGMWKQMWARGANATEPFGDYVTSLWSSFGYLYITSNYGIFKLAHTDSVQQADRLLSLDSFPYRVKGALDNDVLVVGDRSMIWHWNGATWEQVLSGPPTKPLYSIAMRGNLAIVIGVDNYEISSQGLVMIGRR